MPLGMSNFELAQLGLLAGGGIASGMSANSSNKQNRQDIARQQMLDVLKAAIGASQDKSDRYRSDAISFADRQGPLGEEQKYVQRNNILRSILPGLASAGSGPMVGPNDPAIRALMPPSSTKNVLSGLVGQDGQLRPDIAASFSDNATSRSITDKRKALAQVNPEFDYKPLSDYGLTQDADAFHQETMDSGARARGFRDQGFSDVDSILGQMRQSAQGQMNASGAGGKPPDGYEYDKETGELKKKGSSIWKKIAKVGLAAAPFVAAPFTGGASLAAIGAGAGAASGALDGGWKGALMGGAMGGATAGFGGGSGTGMAGVKNAILNPKALSTIAGAGIGGRVGGAIQMAGNFLPGAKAPIPGHQLNNQMSAASLPIGSMGGGPTSLNLPSSPTSGIQGLIAGGLQDNFNPNARVPTGAPRLAVGSPGPQRPPQGMSPSQRPSAEFQGPLPPSPIQGGGGSGAVMRAPTGPEKFLNSGFGQFFGAPNNLNEQPLARIANSPVGALIMGALTGGASSALAPRVPGMGSIPSFRGGTPPIAPPTPSFGPRGGGSFTPPPPPIGGMGAGRPPLNIPSPPTGPSIPFAGGPQHLMTKAQQLNQALQRLAGDTSPSGRNAVSQIQDELLAIYRQNPEIANILLGGRR